MKLAQRKQERTELMAHLLAQDWDVFGTLKFVNGRTIGRDTAQKLLRSYWNKVDRVFFGHAADRQNMRVPRWCFAHEGSDSENFHIHFLLKSPIADAERACTVLNAIWAQHHGYTAPLTELLSNLVFEGSRSCGDLVCGCGFNSVFEPDACDDFGQVIKAA